MGAYKLHLTIGDSETVFTDIDLLAKAVTQLIDSMGSACQKGIELADASFKMPADGPEDPMREGLMLLVRHEDGKESSPFAAVEGLTMDEFLSHSNRRPDKVMDAETGEMYDLNQLN